VVDAECRGPTDASISRRDKGPGVGPATRHPAHSVHAAEVRERRSARHSVRVGSAAAAGSSADYNSPITAS